MKKQKTATINAENAENQTEVNNGINRCEAMVFVEAINSNPNGDPDGDNRPRQNLDGTGLITNVCLKRKLRNLADIRYGEQEGMKILSKIGTYKQTEQEKYFEKNEQGKEEFNTTKYLKDNYDIRMFGDVITAKNQSIGIKGAVQITDAKSFAPISDKIMTITTSQAVPNRIKINKNGTESDTGKLGKRHTLSHALYAYKIYVNPYLCEKNHVSQKDIDLLMDTLVPNMFEEDRSSSRCEMRVRKVIKFNHNDKYGSVPASELFDRVKVTPKVDNPDNYKDYELTIDKDNLPEGVSISVK